MILSAGTIRANTNEALNNAARDGVMIIESTIAKDLSAVEELANRQSTQSMNWATQKEYLANDIERKRIGGKNEKK